MHHLICVSLLLNYVYFVYVADEKLNLLNHQQFFLPSYFHEALAGVYSSLNLFDLVLFSRVVSLSHVDVAFNVLYLSGVDIIGHIDLLISINTLDLFISIS